MMKNLADAFKQYTVEEQNKPQNISNLKTALIRYTLPAFGFVVPSRSSNRFHPNDVDLALEFASGIALDRDICNTLISLQETVLKKAKISLHNARQQRKNLHKFTIFLEEKKVNEEYIVKEKKVYQASKKVVKDCSHIEENRKKASPKQEIKLSLNYQDYSGNDLSNKKEINRIKNELNKFESFLPAIQKAKRTRDETVEVMKRLLGWYYIKENRNLTKVSLQNMIKVFDVNLKVRNFKDRDSHYIARGILIDDAKEEARGVIDFIDSFFCEYEVNSRGTKIKYINSLIALAKYRYLKITDIDECMNYEDIPVIRRLRVFSNRLLKEPQKTNEKLPTWNTVIGVLKELKRRCDNSKYQDGCKKIDTVLASDLQRFLMFGMFTLVPPSRSRVIRELRLGETLKHGLFKDGVFIPKNKLKLGEEAKYYIHLQPEDYKTGNTYGEWRAEFPNVKFKDGTLFYDYLNKWIYEGHRNVLLRNEKHNYLFVGNVKAKPFNKNRINSAIRNMFKSTIKQKVSPHKLRTIYRTYLVNKGASQQELDSCAFWMRHSPEIARKVYTRLTLAQKTNPGLEVTQRLNDELLLAA